MEFVFVRFMQIKHVVLLTTGNSIPVLNRSEYQSSHRRVQGGGGGGGGQGVLTPPFPGPPPLFSSVTPPSTQPDLTDKCDVNCFLIV